METGLKKLEAQEQKYAAELDKVLAEYAELKAQATNFDPVELHDARQAIRPEKELNAVVLTGISTARLLCSTANERHPGCFTNMQTNRPYKS